MKNPIFYIVELDLPETDTDAHLRYFYEWYAHVHTPHLYEAGFTVCTSYRGIAGAMQFVDVYQADDWDIFTSASFANYRKVAAADPHLPSFMGKTANTRTPYHHVAWRDEAIEEMAKPLASDWITVWRFAADEADFADVGGWLAREGEARLKSLGADTIRLLRKTREAPTGTSSRPDSAIVLQWKSQPSDYALSLTALPAKLSEAVAAVPGFTGYRMFPWADAPEIRAQFTTFLDYDNPGAG